MTQVSNEALNWLEFFVINPNARISYETLMDNGISRRRSMAIIKELENAQLVLRKRSLRYGTVMVIMPQGLTTVVSRKTLYNHSASTAIVPIAVQPEMINIATNKFLDGVKEEEKSMTWGGLFDDKPSSEDSERLRQRQKYEAQKKAEYQAMREKKAESRKEAHRSKIDPAAWTCKDIAYEFSDRLSGYWEIAPFSVTQTRFVQALATFRRQHDTNGAIELELVNLFFENLRSEKLTDGNHAWRAFMYKAPQLLPTARQRVITPEQIETAIIDDTARADRKLALLDEDDDV